MFQIFHSILPQHTGHLNASIHYFVQLFQWLQVFGGAFVANIAQLRIDLLHAFLVQLLAQYLKLILQIACKRRGHTQNMAKMHTQNPRSENINSKQHNLEICMEPAQKKWPCRSRPLCLIIADGKLTHMFYEASRASVTLRLVQFGRIGIEAIGLT